MISEVFHPRLLIKNNVESSLKDFALYYPQFGTLLYFEPDNKSNDDTANLLQQFTSSEQFPLFQKQYKDLIYLLDDWCQQNAIQHFYWESDESVVPITAFELLKKRLFDFETDYYSIRLVLFFNSGKKSLEELLLLLSNPNIELSYKKDIMNHLQKGIIVCSDGTLTNVSEAKDDLKAFLGVNSLIANIKHRLIEQAALLYICKKYNPVSFSGLIFEANETHYVKAFCNYVAETYGLPVSNDGFIRSLQIEEHLLVEFADRVALQFTPEAILQQLVSLIDDEMVKMHAQFRAKHGHESFYNDALRISAEQLINAINNKFSPLVELDLLALMDPNVGETAEVRFVDYNKTLMHAQVAKKFRTHYLLETSPQPGRLIINSKQSLIYDNGFFWVENSCLEISELTPELFLCIGVPPAHSVNGVLYCFVLETYFKNALPLGTVHLLVLNGYFPVMIQKKFCALIELSLEYGWITNAHFMDTIRKTSLPNNDILAEWDFIWALAEQEKWSLLRYLVNNQLVHILPDTDLLQQSDDKGKNFAFLLAQKQQWNLLELLLQNNLLQSQHLLAPIREGHYAGTNALWILIYKKQWSLLNKLLESNLLTPRQFSISPEDANKSNAVILLVEYEQWDLLRTLINKNVLQKEHFGAMIPSDLNAGVNVVWLLLSKDKLDLVQLLLKKNMLESSHFSAAPESGVDAHLNVALLLACKSYNLFKKILQHHLITKEQLSATALVGINALWQLVQRKQWSLVRIIIQNDLCTPDALTSAPQDLSHDCYGKNAVWLLIESRQWRLLNQLIRKHLLSSSQLIVASQEEHSQGINSVCQLMVKGKWGLLLSLIEKKIITMSDLKLTLLFMLYENDAVVKPTRSKLKQLQSILDRGLMTAQHIEQLAPGVLSVTNDLVRFNLANPQVSTSLVHYRQWDLLLDNLPTQQELATPLNTDTASGINLLCLLVVNGKRTLLNGLLREQRLNREQFEATIQSGNDAGLNALWFLIYYNQWSFIRRLLNNNLLSTKQFTATSRESETRPGNINALSVLISAKQWGLFEALLNKNLISRELMDNPNYIFLLATHKKISLLQSLLDKKLISKEQFESAAPPAFSIKEGKVRFNSLINRNAPIHFFTPRTVMIPQEHVVELQI